MSIHTIVLKTMSVNNFSYPFRVIGLFEFSSPIFLVRDPKLLKKMTVKDFDSFSDRRIFLTEDVDPLFGRALVSLQGQKWRGLS